jgi:hypothetical protein
MGRILTALLLLTALAAAGAGPLLSDAQAGPRIEFGEDGFLQLDLKLQLFIENSDLGSGPNGTEDRTDIHFQRNRLTATGMLDETWGMKFQTCGNTGTTKTPLGFTFSQPNDWNDRDLRIIDAYVIGDFSDAVHMKLGLSKIPLTRANLDDCFAPLSLDRSMFVYTPFGGSPVKFSRDQGLVFWGFFNNEKLKYWFAAMEGREGRFRWQVPAPLTGIPIPATPVTSSPEPESNLQYVARIHYAFLDPEPGSGYLGTYFGEKRILTIGAGAAFEPDAVFKNVSYDPALDASTLINDEAADYAAYAADLLLEYPFDFGTVTLNSQYLNIDFDNAYKSNLNPADRNTIIAGPNGQKDGGFVKLAYMLPGTIGREGKIQPYVLHERWKFGHLLGNNEQRVEQSGGGINYYVRKQNVRMTLEYLKTKFEKPTTLFGILDATKVTDTDLVRFMFQVVI